MSYQYIDLDSSYRNRTEYPHSSQFVSGLSVNPNSSYSGSSDPLFSSVMTYPPSTDDKEYQSYGFLYGPTPNGVMVPTDNVVSFLPTTGFRYATSTPITPSELENHYIGQTLELVEYLQTGTNVTHEYRIITGYTLGDPQEIETTVTSATYPILTSSVTLNLNIQEDFILDGMTITFTSTTVAGLSGVSRGITYYRAFDRRVFFDEPILSYTITNGDGVVLSIPNYEITLDRAFSVGALPTLTDGFLAGDYTIARIRQSPPSVQDTLTSSTTTTFTLPATVGTRDFTGSTIWITSNPVLQDSQLAGGGFVSDGTSQVQGTFTLPGSASIFPDDFLNGMIIAIDSGNFAGYEYLITDWVQSTLTGTVTPGWTSLVAGTTNPVATDQYRILVLQPSQYRRITAYNTATRVGTVNPPFSYTNEAGTVTAYAPSGEFNILNFYIDNYTTINYPRTNILAQEVCYELELISLTVPIQEIKTGYGGFIYDYPYVYVQFDVQGTSSYNIYSNNRHASKGMFKVMFARSSRPESKFLPADGNGMVQTLRFRPNDAILFSVFLPNGELLEFQQDDFMSPDSPNPLLQISSLFKIRRYK